MLPYLIAVESHSGLQIESIVVKMEVFNHDELLQVGINEMGFGSTVPKPLIIAPRSEVTTYLNTATVTKPVSCKDARISAPGDRIEIRLDSITFSDKTVIGQDTYGVIERGRKRQEARQHLLTVLSTTRLAGESPQPALAALLAMTHPAYEESQRHKIDFLALELDRSARWLLRELAGGQSSQTLETHLKNILDSETNTPLRMR